MQEIKSIDIMSVAKIYAVFGAIIGVITGLFILVGASFFGSFGSLVGAIMVIVLYTVTMAICGAIGALAYNLVAGRFGGIKIELK